MQKLFLNIVTALAKCDENKEKFRAAGLAPIRTIDIYNGQPTNAEQFEFITPAVFIDYAIDWARSGSQIKEGRTKIIAHVITDPMPGTESWNPRLADGIARLRYYELITRILETVGGGNIGRLSAVAEQPEQTEYFDYHTITFDAPVYVNLSQPLTKLEGVEPYITYEQS